MYEKNERTVALLSNKKTSRAKRYKLLDCDVNQRDQK